MDAPDQRLSRSGKGLGERLSWNKKMVSWEYNEMSRGQGRCLERTYRQGHGSE